MSTTTRRSVAELIRKPTRNGDSFYFVGTVPDPTGGHMRVSLFFSERRRNEFGETVDVWEMRSEPLFGPPSPFEVAPSPNRRLGAPRDGGRPQALTGYRPAAGQRDPG